MNLFTRISRKASGGARCVREHGWRYTFYLMLEKMVSRLWMPASITIFFLLRVMPAYHRYVRLKKRMGGTHIYCQYYQGSGDVRYSAAYLRLIHDAATKQEKAMDCVFIVNGKSAAGVAALFCPSEIPVIPWGNRAARSMVHFQRFMGTGSLDMTILHYFDDTMYTSIFFPVMSRMDVTFEKLYTAALLENMKSQPSWIFQGANQNGRQMPVCDGNGQPWQLSVCDDEAHIWPEPVWDDDSEWLENVFTKYGLKFNRTVLISPFANSLAYAPGKKFWESIVMELKHKGYSVCTNVSGRQEKPIRGSIGIFIPYRYLNIFCENAGYFLAFRSGLCDLISMVYCRKVILYPDKGWPDAVKSDTSTIDIFSLKRMGYGDDVEEYVYRPGMDPGMIVRALLRE